MQIILPIAVTPRLFSDFISPLMVKTSNKGKRFHFSRTILPPPLLPAHKITNLFLVPFQLLTIPHGTFDGFKAGTSEAVHLNLEKR
ncbi:hypothetical protein ACFQ5D_11580 [Paenibacillus farraposensis]|uniref:Uncharacterized protein n=1 Tax=Paenibacillus farraposensis TaxID=2807095 RepID=A0ABW4DBE6_9BACL|nr:hypothetical protein [Paenibacillus farraposensis]MCC3378619.1 hypothetical protein [Paenibacillus farraposensis]